MGNPGEGDCRGIRYLCNLLDSVVTLAARKAKENRQKNILSEITGRDLGMQIGTQYLKLTTTKAIVSPQRSSSTKTGRWTQMGASCDLVPAPPLWPPSPRSLIESSSTQTTWSAPPSCPPPETVSLARWSTRVKAAYSALSFICILSYSLVLPSLRWSIGMISLFLGKP